MADLLYRRIDIIPNMEETEPVQFVGVYTLRWHDHPEQPTVGFYEDREAQKRVEELERKNDAMFKRLKQIERLLYLHKDRLAEDTLGTDDHVDGAHDLIKYARDAIKEAKE
jgi:hypothetical protein